MVLGFDNVHAHLHTHVHVHTHVHTRVYPAMFRADAPVQTESTVLQKQRNAAGEVVGVALWPGVWAAAGAKAPATPSQRCRGLTSVLNGEWAPARRGLGGPGWACRAGGAAGGADKGRRGACSGTAAAGTRTHLAVATAALGPGTAPGTAPGAARGPGAGPVPATVVATLADVGLEVVAAEVFVASPDRAVFTFVDLVCGPLGGPRPPPPGSPVVLVEMKTGGAGGGTGAAKHRFAQPLHALPGNALGAATAQMAATAYMFNECRPGGWVPVAAYLLHIAKVPNATPAQAPGAGAGAGAGAEPALAPVRRARATGITLTPAGEPWWHTGADPAAWNTYLDVGWCLVEARPSAWMTLPRDSPEWHDAKAALAAGTAAAAAITKSGARAKPDHTVTVVVPPRVPKPKPTPKPRGEASTRKRVKPNPDTDTDTELGSGLKPGPKPRARAKPKPKAKAVVPMAAPCESFP